MRRSMMFLCSYPLFFAALVTPLHARVTSFEIDRQVPYGRFNGVEFHRIEAKVRGELTRDERIPNLEQVLETTAGRATYETRVLLIAPASRASGALLLEVPNRNRVISHALYNGLREPATGLGSLEPGTGYLQRSGHAIASVTWEYGEGIVVPKFRDTTGVYRNVESVAFAAVRDVALFLRDARADDAGRPNPLAGLINRAYASGYSQTARFLRTFLSRGFNTEGGRVVFAGLHLHAGAAGQMPILEAGTGERSATAGPTPNFVRPDLRGVQEPPFSYAEIIAGMRARGEPLPKIMVTNMTTDYLSIRASLARTGIEGGIIDLPIPENVRMYDVAGAAHDLARDALTHENCSLPLGRLDVRPVMRSTLANLDAWVARAIEPPPSALMPLSAEAVDGKVLRAPAHLARAIVLAPQRTQDGNFAGGVRLPEVEVPLGVHGVQNAPLEKDPCRLSAAFEAYAASVVSDRYDSHDAYVKRIEDAATALVRRRFLLQEDAQVIISAARALRWPK